MKRYIIIFLLLIGLQSQGQRVLTLQECRDLAIDYNKSLQMAGVDAQKAQANQKLARTAYLPALDGTASATYLPSLDDIEIPGMFLPTADADGNTTGDSEAYFPGLSLNTEKLSLYQAQLALTIPIYAGGQIRNANKMADLGVNMSQNALELERDRVIQSTDEAFWQLVALEENIKVAKIYVAMMDSLEDQLTTMYELGLSPKSEQLKVSVQKNDAELALLRANNGLSILKMRLCQLMGLPLQEDIRLDGQLAENMPLPNMDNAWAKASINRKELLIMEDQIKIAELSKQNTAGEYKPTVGAQISYSYLNSPNLDFDSWNTMAVAQVSLPVFHWKERKHKLAAASLDQEKTKLEYDNSRELIQLEVSNLTIRVQEAYQTIVLAQKSCAQAQESLEEVALSYEAGLNTTTDLLNAQAAWQRAESNKVEALTNLEIAKTAYQKGIGMLNSISASN
ncbi:TolC family protein [Mangrovibacterium sp.]|uniref:TolC family protein n=1 Tax=Mangrovibacterium sp. TaxID=1961364 RepID=UPI0035653AA0